MRVMGKAQLRMPEDEHDADRTRSPSPAPTEQLPKIHSYASWIGNPGIRVNTLLHEGPSPAPIVLHDPSPFSATSRRHPANVGVGRGNWPRKPKENISQAPEILPQQPQPHPFYQAAPIHPAHIAHAPPMYYFNPDPNIPHVQHMASPRGSIPVQYVQVMHGPQQIGPPAYYHPSGHYLQSQIFHDPASVNGSVRIGDAMVAGTSGSSKRSSRPQTTYQQAIEQSRRMQVDRLLWTNMHRIQSRKRKERKRRGVVVDAWVKCVRLPDGWDSEDDVGGRLGGVDDITRVGPRAVAGAVSGTNGGTAGQGDAASTQEEEWGDVGARAGVVARSFRRVGKKLDGIIIGGHGQRRRWARADGAGYPDNEAGFDALSPLRGPRSAMDNADSQLLPGYTVTTGPTVASEYKKREDPTSTPTAKKKLIKRKPPQKRSTAAAAAARQGGQAHLNGQQGIPVREFLAHRPMGVWRPAGSDDDGACWLEMEDAEGVHRRIGMLYDRRIFDENKTESGLGALATDRLARAAEEEEEIDEVDRELLADVDADESGSGSESVQGVHDSVALGNGGRGRSENASSNGDANGDGAKSPGGGEHYGRVIDD